MVYFDAAYIAKCYLNEPNAEAWFAVSSSLIRLACQNVSSLPSIAFLRAVDAIHLTCAKENGFIEVYTNDRRMLDCAKYFQVRGVNLIP